MPAGKASEQGFEERAALARPFRDVCPRGLRARCGRLARDLVHALLDLIARLPGLLRDLVHDLVGIVARLLHVVVRELVELLDEPLLELRRVLADLLLQDVVEAPLYLLE